VSHHKISVKHLTEGNSKGMVNYVALCYGLGIPVVVFFALYAFAYSWWWVSDMFSDSFDTI